jgi:hypothetical protein
MKALLGTGQGTTTGYLQTAITTKTAIKNLLFRPDGNMAFALVPSIGVPVLPGELMLLVTIGSGSHITGPSILVARKQTTATWAIFSPYW